MFTAMVTRIVVFPVHGRRWAFSVVSKASSEGHTTPPPSLQQLWRNLREENTKTLGDRFELVTRYASDKMHEKWISLENAPAKSIRSRIYSIGQKLLARLEPSELFLKSIPKEATKAEILFPSSINPRLVRRRVRHVAISGSIFHRRYMYGSCMLLPFTALLGVLPFPNIPLFWNLFRAHAHWRALQGSKKLSQLVTDDWKRESQSNDNSMEELVSRSGIKNKKNVNASARPWVLLPSKKLANLIAPLQADDISDRTIEAICQEFCIDATEILKWRNRK